MIDNCTSVLLAVCLYFCGATASAAELPIIQKGQIGCLNWMAERPIDYAGPIEQLVIGYLDGVSRALHVAFWKADAADDQKSVYKWLDNYCSQHSLSTVLGGADVLFKARTGKEPFLENSN